MMVRAVGSELLVIGLMFIAVKWNRKNGIMSGFGCLCATVSIFFHTLSQDQGEFVFLRHAYIIAAMMFVGGMHVQFFPSNIYKKTGKSNHGNTSDIVAILCIVLSIQSIFFTSSIFEGVELVSLSGIASKSGGSWSYSSSKASDVAVFLTKISGSLLFVISMMFSAVKWYVFVYLSFGMHIHNLHTHKNRNRANGKLGGLGCFLAIGNLYGFGDALNVNDFLDGKVNALHFMSLALLVGGIHVFFFPSNKLPKRVDKSR